MKGRKIFVVFLLLFSILLTSFGFWTYQMLYSPNILVGKEERILVIRRGESFKSIQDRLYDSRIVNDIVSFSFLAKLMNYDEQVKPGRYVLKPDMNNLQTIRMLRAGKQEPVNITFNNVRLIEDLAPKITSNILMTEDEFNQALNDYLDTNAEGWDRNTIIGMFIPNTYEVYYDITGKDLISRMNREYHNFWNEDRQAKADSIGLTPLEVSTLASIVQAESVKGDESARIAGLYMNRLNRDIALQADPTLVFASGDFTLKRVLNKHKEIDSPYNTYMYAGLPPGPINMPTIRSLDAVLDFEEHSFLYMCAKEDFSGYHNFARTLNEHLVNARRYQRALTIEQRKARAQAQVN